MKFARDDNQEFYFILRLIQKKTHNKLKLIKIKNHLSPSPQHVSNLFSTDCIFSSLFYVQLQQMFSLSAFKSNEKSFFMRKKRSNSKIHSFKFYYQTLWRRKSFEINCSNFEISFTAASASVGDYHSQINEFLYENYGKYFPNEHE